MTPTGSNEPNPQDAPSEKPKQASSPERLDTKTNPATANDTAVRVDDQTIQVDGEAACAVKTEASKLAHRILALIAAPALLLAVLYWQSFAALGSVWMKDDNYSHGWFIPIFSAMFALTAWQRREDQADTVPLPKLDEVSTTDMIGGSIELAAAIFLHWVALIGGILLLDVLALCIALGAVLRIVGGMDLKNIFRFPIWFLIFMAPLPGLIYQPLARTLQLTAAKAATFAFEIFGEPVYRQGYTISLRSEHMQVGEACSGIRSLTAIVALAFVVGFFMNRSKLFRWILVLTSPLVAIGTNCIRVVITGYIMVFFGREWAAGKWHEAEGMILIGLGALITIGLALLLAYLEDKWWKPATAEATESGASTVAADDPTGNEVVTFETSKQKPSEESDDVDSDTT